MKVNPTLAFEFFALFEVKQVEIEPSHKFKTLVVDGTGVLSLEFVTVLLFGGISFSKEFQLHFIIFLVIIFFLWKWCFLPCLSSFSFLECL